MNDVDVVERDRSPKTRAPVTVYTPESVLRSPGRLLWSMWRDLLASRELAWRLMVRDINARYRQSALGILWSFLSPLASAAVFVGMRNQGVLNVGATDVPYPAYVICGTMFWNLFIACLLTPLSAVTGGSTILTKINFPREALILSALGRALFDFGIQVVILGGVFALYGVPLTCGLLLTPLALLMLMLLGLILGMLIMPLGVLYNDVNAALNALIGLWFFLTPVLYTPERSPSWLVALNPVSPLLVGARDLATRGVLSNPIPFAIVSGMTLIGLFGVWVLYRVSLPILIERMHA